VIIEKERKREREREREREKMREREDMFFYALDTFYVLLASYSR